MRKIEISLLFGLIFSLCISVSGFEQRCQSVRDEVFRLHIKANSDSEYDQGLKLKVRDSIIELSEGLFCESKNKDDAIKTAKENLPAIIETAENTLKENGCDLKVSARVDKSLFDTRVYGDITMPAGYYNSLVLEIGEGKGKNWWCVMFPQMCVPAAESTTELSQVLDTSQMDLVEGGEKYVVRFKCIEMYEEIVNYFKSGDKLYEARLA